MICFTLYITDSPTSSFLNQIAHSQQQQARPTIDHSPQPVTPDEDGDIANESIFAMDHRITHNYEMSDEKYFSHETHTIDLSKPIPAECVGYDEISRRGHLHNECIMMHLQAQFIQYKPDSKHDVHISGELYLSNYLLYFEPQHLPDVPGGMEHLGMT